VRRTCFDVRFRRMHFTLGQRNKFDARWTTDNEHLTTQPTPSAKNVEALTKEWSPTTQDSSTSVIALIPAADPTGESTLPERSERSR